LEALLYAELRTSAVLYRALAGLLVNIAASGLLVLALGIEGRPLGVVVGAALQLGLLAALFWEDERFAVLRERGTWRFVSLHAATVAAVSLLTYGLLDAAGAEQAGACAVVVLAAAISIAFLRAYRPVADG